MKKLVCSLCFIVAAMWTNATSAQIGTISTFAPLTACNITVDNNGNVYHGSGSSVYRVDSGGNQTLVAGGGLTYGDGGLATAAQLISAVKVAFDGAGNMYICDKGYGVIRKVNTAGIISTVAGSHTLGAGYTGDGGPATAARLNCDYICLDAASNLYIADETDFVIRKVNTSGIITTVAGNGTNIYSGDGGPATSAGLAVACCNGANNFGIMTDISGNLYITDAVNYRVRKVNTAGIISTFAGNGMTGQGGDGGPAASAHVYFPQGMAKDLAGNLYIAEWQNCVLAAVNTAGIYYTVAGNYTISFSGDGGDATAAGMNAVSDVAIAPNGDIYISDCHNGRIRKVIASPSFSTDSFSVYVNHGCSGPAVSVYTHSYVAGMHVKAYFGDGIVPVDSAIVSGNNGGYALINHSYAATGTYSVRLVLYNGNTKLDSLHFTYDNIFCSTTSVQFYNDANSNCIKDATESNSQQPVLVQVDSNNVHVDTISATSGFYYTAYGNAGDVYKFKVLTAPAGMQTACPANGSITTTLPSGTTATQYIGFSCINGNNFDLSAEAVIPVVGIHDQWGNIYVRNNFCTPTNATVTLNFSPKYVYNAGWAHPTPTSVNGSSITWNLTSLSASDQSPTDLYFAIWDNPATGLLTVGDTVQCHVTVTPTAGDSDPTNNSIVIHDTVKGSCDPNLMEVSPEGGIAPGTQLKYRIEFENVGNDTAFNIYVLDTLPNEVDANSMRIVSSTHPMYVSPYGDGAHNIVKFDFPHINLLDSSHHEACTGTFSYTIKTKTGLPFGTLIDHRAGIYFDDNGLVLTNTVENMIGWPSDVATVNKGDGLELYPNPANNELTIKTEKGLYSSCTVMNGLGQVVMKMQMNGAETKLNVKALAAGMYYVNMVGDKGSVVRKFVKK